MVPFFAALSIPLGTLYEVQRRMMLKKVDGGVLEIPAGSRYKQTPTDREKLTKLCGSTVVFLVPHLVLLGFTVLGFLIMLAS